MENPDTTDLVEIEFLSESGESIGTVSLSKAEWSLIEEHAEKSGLTIDQYMIDMLRRTLEIYNGTQEETQEETVAGPEDETEVS